MTAINKDSLRRKDEKLPLAILIHYNVYTSFIFATLIGRLVFHKKSHLYYSNEFQRSLLVPVYLVWLIAEIPRLYVGQKGVLGDKLPEMTAFLLLSFFPQVWTVVYLGYLQELIFPVDSILGTAMMIFISLELVLAWRLLRTIITRQSALFYRNVGLVDANE